MLDCIFQVLLEPAYLFVLCCNLVLKHFNSVLKLFNLVVKRIFLKLLSGRAIQFVDVDRVTNLVLQIFVLFF